MPNTASVSQQRPMNCRFDDILTFIRVVESGSVTAAATRLNVSKSVISKRISDLKSALRVEPFQRSTGSVKPTEFARSFCERIAPIIRGITEATEGVSRRADSLTGRLRIPPRYHLGLTFWGPVIAEFARCTSGVKIVVDDEDWSVNLAQAGYDFGCTCRGPKEFKPKGAQAL